MKRITRQLCMLLALMCALALFAPAGAGYYDPDVGYVYDEFFYDILPDGTAAITGVVGGGANIIVPASVDGLAVTQISESAFEGNPWLESVALPDTVRRICAYAFYGCETMKTFYLPPSLEVVENYAFASCVSLANIYVREGNSVYRDIDGILYGKSGRNLVCCPTGRYGVVNVPAGVTDIEKLAFFGCATVEAITLPDSVTSIGVAAFSGCSGISEITLPNGLRQIPNEAFYNATALVKAVIPAGVTTIAPSAFMYETASGDRPMPGLTIYGSSGSAAAEYCAGNAIRFSVASTTPTGGGALPGQFVRFAGADRIQTALLASGSGWSGASTVVLANGFSYPDALAGVPLAGAMSAPVLLTAGKTLEPAVLAEIKRLGAKKVYVLGGTAAISQSTSDTLRSAGLEVQRLAGANRFETAVAIAMELEARTDRRITDFFFVSAENFPDALAVSPVAAIDGNPILYLRRNGEVDDATAQFISGTSCRSATIIGGEGAISKRSENSVRQLGFSVMRLSGSDRYETALTICQFYSDRFSGSGAVVATGANFPDALAGGALAALNRYPLVLVNSASADKAGGYLRGRSTGQYIILGGTGVLSDSVMSRLA